MTEEQQLELKKGITAVQERIATLTADRDTYRAAAQELLAEALESRKLIPTLEARIAILEAQVAEKWGIASVKHIVRDGRGLIESIVTEERKPDGNADGN